MLRNDYCSYETDLWSIMEQILKSHVRIYALQK
jgi:hypothetical protein